MKKTLRHVLITAVALGASVSVLAACGKKKAPQKSKAPTITKHARVSNGQSMKQMPNSMQHIYRSLSRKPNVRESIGASAIQIENIKRHGKIKMTRIGITHITKHGNTYDVVGNAKNKIIKISITKERNHIMKFSQKALRLSFTGTQTTAKSLKPKNNAINKDTQKMNKRLKRAKHAAKGNGKNKRQKLNRK